MNYKIKNLEKKVSELFQQSEIERHGGVVVIPFPDTEGKSYTEIYTIWEKRANRFLRENPPNHQRGYLIVPGMIDQDEWEGMAILAMENQREQEQRLIGED